MKTLNLILSALAVGVVLTLPSSVSAALVADVSGGVLWLDAEQIPIQANGSNLAAWSDNSGANHPMGQATAAYQPNYVTAANGLNGRAVVRFNGGEAMFTGAVATFSDYTAMIVYQFDAGSLTADRVVLAKYDYPNSKREWAMLYNGGNARLTTRTSVDGAASQDVSYGSAAPPAGSYNLEVVRKKDTAAPLWRNGATISTSGSAADTLYAGNSHMSLGGVNGTTPVSTLVGNIAEVVVYSRDINDGERIVLQNYLAAKWNRTLTSDDYYAGDTPGNGDYDSDLIGIGQAGGGKLATSHGSGLRISEYAGTLDTNGEFVLAGHKTPVNVLTADDVGSLSGVTDRWSRVWYVDRTNAVGATLQFDFGDGGLSAPPAGQTYSLLYSVTNAFNFSVLDSTTTVTSGDQVSFNLGAGFADGYYTLGLRVPEPSTLALLVLGGLAALPCRRRRRA
jgi:hypothetical protein